MKVMGMVLLTLTGLALGCLLALKTAIALTPTMLLDDRKDLTSPTLFVTGGALRASEITEAYDLQPALGYRLFQPTEATL